MGGLFSSDASAQASAHKEEDALTVGLSIDEMEELMRPALETRTAAVRRLAKRDKLLEIFKSVTFGTAVGQYSFLSVIAIILLAVGTLAWSSTQGTEAYDTSLDQSLWLSYGLFIDIGTRPRLRYPHGRAPHTHELHAHTRACLSPSLVCA
jgi:hypothetical protein